MIVDSYFPEIISDNLILHPEEFCYVVYMPILTDSLIKIPDNLSWIWPLIKEITEDDYMDYQFWYLTVKHMWINGCGNREGWHTDGFGTDDINYIWCDSVPTEYCIQKFDISEDHNESLIDMKLQALPKNVVRSKENQLLRLTPSIVHRPYPSEEPTLRTFVKVSCSNEIYNLKGNASNPLMPELNWEQVERQQHRNHPVGVK